MAQHNNHELGGARLDFVTSTPTLGEASLDGGVDDICTPYQQGRDLVVTVEQGVLDNFHKRYLDRIDELFIDWVIQDKCDPRMLWVKSGKLYDSILQKGCDYEIFMLSDISRHDFQNRVWELSKQKLEIINPEVFDTDAMGQELDAFVFPECALGVVSLRELVPLNN